jgi:hypothetical protein
LKSAPDGGEWSATHYDRFNPREIDPGTYWTGGWLGPRAGLDAVCKHLKYNFIKHKGMTLIFVQLCYGTPLVSFVTDKRGPGDVKIRLRTVKHKRNGKVLQFPSTKRTSSVGNTEEISFVFRKVLQ